MTAVDVETDLEVIQLMDFEESKACEFRNLTAAPCRNTATLLGEYTCCGISALFCHQCAARLRSVVAACGCVVGRDLCVHCGGPWGGLVFHPLNP